MKRWLVRISVCLFLGTITTVAVAWGSACFMLVNQEFDEHDCVEAREWGADQDWSIAREDRLGATYVGSLRIATKYEKIRRTDPSPRELLPHWAPLDQPLSDFTSGAASSEIRHLEARGWPFRAVWYEAGRVLDASRRFGAAGGILLPPSARSIGQYERALPLRPIWSGFLINTLFYAPIWFGLFFGFTRAKRFVRTQRGRCPRCGYDLRGQMHTGCPECGWNREAHSS